MTTCVICDRPSPRSICGHLCLLVQQGHISPLIAAKVRESRKRKKEQ